MARYSTDTGMGGTRQAMAASPKTLISITSPATVRRAYIFDFNVGADGTPGDTTLTHKVDRQTTVGTGTAITPAPTDPADGATTVVGTANHTGEPTVTSSTQLFSAAVNQRANFRWVASPGGELIVPAVSANGIGLRTSSASYAGTMVANIHFWD